MVITMAKLRMAHASTHGARKPPGPTYYQMFLEITTILALYYMKLQTTEKYSGFSTWSVDLKMSRMPCLHEFHRYKDIKI